MGSRSGSESPPLPPPPENSQPCCACDCRRCWSPAAWKRTVKRKLDEIDDDESVSLALLGADVAARVEVENEVAALREALASHQRTVQELYAELEEERSASASAASEAMSMILRLQREKAEVQMESRQFTRFAEERMAHDHQELLTLEDILFRREEAVQSLSCELQAYRHRLLSFGITPDADGNGGNNNGTEYVEEEDNDRDYPPLRCYDNMINNHRDYNADDEEETDLEKCAYEAGETPEPTREHLQRLEDRICQLERTPSSAHVNSAVMEKAVVVGQSPRALVRHYPRVSSSGSLGSFNGEQNEEIPGVVDCGSDGGGDDDTSDRVYTIDAVHRAPPEPAPVVGLSEDSVSTPRESVWQVDLDGGGGGEETDIKKLYTRLHALEADRESMRQAIISMRTDKAQLVLLREIAQHLVREVSPPPPPPPERRIVKKPSFIWSFSLVSVIKWIVSFVFWKKKAQRSKYMIGLSNNNVGLLLLLEKSPRMRQWRCLTTMRG